MACTRATPARVGEYEAVTGSFKLLDAHSFKRTWGIPLPAQHDPDSIPSEIHNFACGPDEEPTAVLALPGHAPDAAFCLGTVFIRPEETEPTKGRILLFGISSDEGASNGFVRSLRTLASREVPGCAYALVRMTDELIVAAVNTAVSDGISMPGRLQKMD